MAEANIRPELIAAKLNRSVRAIKARAYAIGLPLKWFKLKAKANEPMVSEEAPLLSFKCPKLNCGAEYFAIEQDVSRAAKPKCLDCGTPFCRAPARSLSITIVPDTSSTEGARQDPHKVCFS
jgi:hypothetical protein